MSSPQMTRMFGWSDGIACLRVDRVLLHRVNRGPRVVASPRPGEAQTGRVADGRWVTTTTRGNGALASWRDGDAKRAVLQCVRRAAAEVPAEERVAVFDNDGTLWCEKPMPIQADFILRRLPEMAEANPALRDRQPWKAAYEHDYAWLGAVLAAHYAGDDTEIPTLLGGV